ncbi:MAG: zf-HC2 domain-containing protein [Ignavibacterium sp.]|jgi:hypothetical protein|uniref:zf-HC2 domain-containing protein n=1 Tax=Ignavibacterium sp. TaxID=2651167 RepID=UPI003298AECD
MKCNLENRKELIGKYLLNELSEDECLKFEEHYFSCEECFNQLKVAEEAVHFIKNNRFSVTHESEKTNFLDKIFGEFTKPIKWGIALASMVILFFIAYTIFNKSPEIQKDEVITKDESDSLKNRIQDKSPVEITDNINSEKNQNNLIAELTGEEFKINPYYEELIKENVRSTAQMLEKVISPLPGDTISASQILFRFKVNEDKPIILTLLNNKEEKKFSGELDQNMFPEYDYKLNTGSLKPGLYYWRIEDENDVYFVGKFHLVKR